MDSPAATAAAAAAASASSAATSSSTPAADSTTAATPALVLPPLRARLALNLPPGYHFLPTDAELVVHFLRPKLAGRPLPLPIFIQKRVLDYHPDKLIEKYREYGEDRWFFFTWRERKHAGGNRPNRTTPDNGHWNATGSPKQIHSGGVLVGYVRTLVFYEAWPEETKSKEEENQEVEAVPPPPPPVLEEKKKAQAQARKGLMTEWTMYEYESVDSEAEFEATRRGHGNMDGELVLCTIQRKKHQHRKEGKSGGKKKQTAAKRKKKEGVQDAMPAAAAVAGNDEIEECKSGGAKKRRRSKRTTEEAPEDQDRYHSAPVETAPEETVDVDQPPAGAVDSFSAKMTHRANRLSPVPTPPTPPQEMMRMPTRPAATRDHLRWTGGETLLNTSTSSMMQLLLSRDECGTIAPEMAAQPELSSAAWFDYPQQQQHNATTAAAPPAVHDSSPKYGFSADSVRLLGTDMDYCFDSSSSFSFKSEASYGVGNAGMISTQGMFMHNNGVSVSNNQSLGFDPAAMTMAGLMQWWHPSSTNNDGQGWSK